MLVVEAVGIALAILGDFNYPIRDNRRHGRSEISKRFAGAVESLAHRQGRGVVEGNILDRNDIHSGLPKVGAGAQERLSVTEARSRFGDSQPCSFVEGVSDQYSSPVDSAQTCRLDGVELAPN